MEKTEKEVRCSIRAGRDVEFTPNLNEIVRTNEDKVPRGFIASGEILAGKVVGLKSDGTIEEITGELDFSGDEVVFYSGETFNIKSTFDSTNNKVVIIYIDGENSNQGTAIVGTVSGTSISFGTPVVFNTDNTTNISITFDSTNNKVVIAYTDGGNSNQGTAIVGTVSGTSISFGTPVVFNVGEISSDISTTFDSTNNKVVIAYRDYGNSHYGTTVVGTVSGTSISFGTPVVFASITTLRTSTTFDSNSNDVVIVYQDNDNLDYGVAVVGTVTGTSISFGTPVIFASGTTSNISSTFDSNSNKVVIVYKFGFPSSINLAIVGTVSGTSISFGTPVEFTSGTISYISSTFDSTNNKVVVIYQQETDDFFYNGKAIVGTVSGDTISFSPVVIFNSGSTLFIDSTKFTSSTFDSLNNKVVINYSNDGIGASIVFWSTDWLTTNVDTTIGIAAENIVDGKTGIMTVGGNINDQQSGLIINTLYYVDFTGTITATPDTNWDYKLLGKAVSETEILMGSI